MNKPTPIRLYKYLLKQDAVMTTGVLAEAFKQSYANIRNRLNKAVKAGLVLRTYFNTKYYYMASAPPTNPIFYETSLHAPIIPKPPITIEEFKLLLIDAEVPKQKISLTCKIRYRIGSWLKKLNRMVTPSGLY